MGRQLTVEGSVFRDEIMKHGYSEFSHGIETEEIEALTEAYAAFTCGFPNPRPETMDAMLPKTLYIEDSLDVLDRSQDVQRNWHKYRTNAVGVGKPDGYTNRSFQERALREARGLHLPEAEDPKEYYHFTPRHLTNMIRQHKKFGWGPLPPEVLFLDERFRPIHKKASKLIIKAASYIEETHPEIRNFFTTESLSTSPVRLLFYHPSDRTQLGAGHYDKGALTIQIAESHQGLQVSNSKESPLQPVVRSDEKALMFPGISLGNVLEDNDIYPPGWHDIVKTNQLNEGRFVPRQAASVCARWALIFFANGSNFVDRGKAATHQQ